jgi:hypothetical protein
VIVRNNSENERSERHDAGLDQINIRCSRHALEISKVRTYVHERVDSCEAKSTKGLAELGERLSRHNRIAYEDLQSRLNEYSERLDKGTEALAEKVNDMDARMDDFVVMDFHPIIDGRVHELMRELNYKVTHLGEKTERLGTALDNHTSRPLPGTDELRETVVQLQANMDCLHREQLETGVKLNAVDHCSLRLDRSVAELRTGIERQEVVLNEKIAASYSDAISWFRDSTVGTETVNGYSLTRNGRHMRKSGSRDRSKKRSESKRRSKRDDSPDSSDSSSSSSSSDTDEADRPRKSRKRKDDSDVTVIVMPAGGAAVNEERAGC